MRKSTTLRDILGLVNAAHIINVYSEESNLVAGEDDCSPVTVDSPDYYTRKVKIKTTIFGTPEREVQEDLLDRIVRCQFPYKSKLIVHLENKGYGESDGV